MLVVLSVKCGGLPEERGQLARAGDRDHAGRLASLVVEVLPAVVQTPLRPPGDLEHAWVLAMLAPGERLTDARRVAVVMGRLDQQPAGVARPGFGDRALAALAVRGALGGDDPEEACQPAWPLERAKSPISAARPAAESVSMPRKQRSLATTGA